MTQSVENAVQMDQIVSLAVGFGPAAPAEELTELFGSDDQRIVEGLQVGRDQSIGFLVIDNQVRQRGRCACRCGPMESDLAIGLDDARSHRPCASR
ncbi:hypothetical protein MHPYR_50023 [uncultured Mycobacterium sp.]|uniref:Uncharacterized protein n=1 Tax=uncultured Mycobacterium sp. TaxID=171292 RepID=A0A1Y5PGK7_9MYCO|nr:hypothetical protein MHPYR_50023 [uncultured Mycobacterium sp.]